MRPSRSLRPFVASFAQAVWLLSSPQRRRSFDQRPADRSECSAGPVRGLPRKVEAPTRGQGLKTTNLGKEPFVVQIDVHIMVYIICKIDLC